MCFQPQKRHGRPLDHEISSSQVVDSNLLEISHTPTRPIATLSLSLCPTLLLSAESRQTERERKRETEGERKYVQIRHLYQHSSGIIICSFRRECMPVFNNLPSFPCIPHNARPKVHMHMRLPRRIIPCICSKKGTVKNRCPPSAVGTAPLPPFYPHSPPVFPSSPATSPNEPPATGMHAKRFRGISAGK
ncbi:hypothetical protein LY76DRAFT_175785 [Colletotrichum caudatum]|nr:hypothetical protein LY76DRAFT_175785 [Colletotrichum caudatum]